MKRLALQIVFQYVGSSGSYDLSWNCLPYLCLNLQKCDRLLPCCFSTDTLNLSEKAIAFLN